MRVWLFTWLQVWRFRITWKYIRLRITKLSLDGAIVYRPACGPTSHLGKEADVNGTVVSRDLSEATFAAIDAAVRPLRFVYLGMRDRTLVFRSADVIDQDHLDSALSSIETALAASDNPYVKAELARSPSIGIL
jgi:hypothetical protein